jgi:hypothetical protein
MCFNDQVSILVQKISKHQFSSKQFLKKQKRNFTYYFFVFLKIEFEKSFFKINQLSSNQDILSKSIN